MRTAKGCPGVRVEILFSCQPFSSRPQMPVNDAQDCRVEIHYTGVDETRGSRTRRTVPQRCSFLFKQIPTADHSLPGITEREEEIWWRPNAVSNATGNNV